MRPRSSLLRGPVWCAPHVGLGQLGAPFCHVRRSSRPTTHQPHATEVCASRSTRPFLPGARCTRILTTVAARMIPGFSPHVVIDTSRNGFAVGDCRAWCNVRNAALGEWPTHETLLPEIVDAYLWVKPPGESDGCSSPRCARFDPSCASWSSLGGHGSVSEPAAPEAGEMFPFQLVQLGRVHLNSSTHPHTEHEGVSPSAYDPSILHLAPPPTPPMPQHATFRRSSPPLAHPSSRDIADGWATSSSAPPPPTSVTHGHAGWSPATDPAIPEEASHPRPPSDAHMADHMALSVLPLWLSAAAFLGCALVPLAVSLKACATARRGSGRRTQLADGPHADEHATSKTCQASTRSVKQGGQDVELSSTMTKGAEAAIGDTETVTGDDDDGAGEGAAVEAEEEPARKRSDKRHRSRNRKQQKPSSTRLMATPERTWDVSPVMGVE
jgi:hypothetical protein